MCSGEIDSSGVSRFWKIKECAAAAGIGRNAKEKNFAGLDFFCTKILAKEMVRRNRGGAGAVTDCVASS